MNDVGETGPARPSMVVLTRWAVDPDSCGCPPDDRFVEGDNVHQKSDALDGRGSSADRKGPGGDEEQNAGVPFGGWFVSGPGIPPTAVSFVDPLVPNLQLIKKLLFMKIVDVSVNF